MVVGLEVDAAPGSGAARVFSFPLRERFGGSGVKNLLANLGVHRLYI